MSSDHQFLRPGLRGGFRVDAKTYLRSGEREITTRQGASEQIGGIELDAPGSGSFERDHTSVHLC